MHGKLTKTKGRKFQKLFATPSFAVPAKYYMKDGRKPSLFDRCCDYVTATFSKPWGKVADRLKYLATFSTKAWKSLKDEEKSEHSLSNFKLCFYQNTPCQIANYAFITTMKSRRPIQQGSF